MLGLRLAAGLALFAVVAVVAGVPAGARADRAVTVWVQRAAPLGDVPAAALALLGDPEVIPGLAAAGLVLLVLGDTRRGRAALWLAAGAAASSLIVDVFQSLIVHPGPPVALTRPIAEREFAFFGYREIVLALAGAGLVVVVSDKRRGRALLWLTAGAAGVAVAAVAFQDVIVRAGQEMLSTAGLSSTYGFPSGHMVRTTLLVGSALRRVPAAAPAILVGMAASLVYLGVHSLSEVVGGFCLGWACVEGARKVWEAVTPP